MPANNKIKHIHFLRQRELIVRSFPSFKCDIKLDVLTCNMKITPSEGCATYSILIKYKFLKTPRVSVVSPKIPKELWKRVHVFPTTGELCLFDCRQGGQPWKSEDNIHETIIPWTSEWLVYYELFLKLGEWLGPEAPHTKPKITNT